MDPAVVKGVPGEDFSCLVCPCGSEARIVIIHPRKLSAELVLLADEIDLPAVRNSGVKVGVESGIFLRIKPCRSRDPREVVDDQNALAVAVFRQTDAEGLGRETLSTFVEGDDAIAVDVSRND